MAPPCPSSQPSSDSPGRIIDAEAFGKKGPQVGAGLVAPATNLRFNTTGLSSDEATVKMAVMSAAPCSGDASTRI